MHQPFADAIVRRVRSAFTLMALTFALLLPQFLRAELIAFPESHNKLTVLRDGRPFVHLEFVAWGKNWSWMGFRGDVTARGTGTRFVNSAENAGAEVELTAEVQRSGDRQLTMHTSLIAKQRTEVTYIVLSVTPARQGFRHGELTTISAAGQKKTLTLPLGKQPLGDQLRQCAFTGPAGNFELTMQPPCAVTADGAVRIILAADAVPANKKFDAAFTLELPAAVKYFASAADIPTDIDTDRWFEFTPDNRHDEPTEIGMRDWLERPAGKHGRIKAVKDKLVYDQRPIKLWGLNLCYSACAPDREMAEKRARFYSKYGINSVRLHKYADGPGWAGIQSPDSFVAFDKEGLDRMDYMVSQFKQHGIYVKLSAHFGAQKLGPADRQTVPYLEEFGSFSERTRRITTPHSAVHYSPELQQLQIRQMVNLLRHKNPYTQLTYAEDPAVAFVEIINEQSILFFTSMTPLKISATLRKHVGRRFCDWLREKYGTQEQLAEAWGKDSFNIFAGEGFPQIDEHLDQNNILPLGNPWYWDPAQLNTSQESRRRRHLDTLEFLYVLQNEFYAKYVEAVRQAGYEGEIVSSNWQAGRAASHFYNLHSDALVGTIDRHNYFGGSDGSVIRNASMLALPGSGILSAGMQQVVDRPFMLSEWIHVTPNEWGVEGPALIGAYGMGLQGWDVSYMFQNRDQGEFSTRIAEDRWDVTAPNVMTVFPAVARQVLRGDVRESDKVAAINVHVPSLSDARLSAQDKVTQQYDIKTFESEEIPAQTLAIARCGVRFTDTFLKTPTFPIDQYTDRQAIVSTTKQLRWYAGQNKLDGYCTIDTAGTKAVVGFAAGRDCELGEVTIRPECRYAAIYVTAREMDRTLRNSEAWLIVAVARARNTGMKIFNDDRLLERGSSPVLMEPVKASFSVAGRGSPTVHVLDHSGRRTGETLPTNGHRFEIDGARDKTCYYLVTF
jgi:hypothetical protein